MLSFRATFQGVALALSLYPVYSVTLVVNEPSLPSPRQGDLVVTWRTVPGDPLDFDLSINCPNIQTLLRRARKSDSQAQFLLPSDLSDGNFTCYIQATDSINFRKILVNRGFELVVSKMTQGELSESLVVSQPTYTFINKSSPSPSCLPVDDGAEKIFARMPAMVTLSTTTFSTTPTFADPPTTPIPQVSQPSLPSQGIPTTATTTPITRPTTRPIVTTVSTTSPTDNTGSTTSPTENTIFPTPLTGNTTSTISPTNDTISNAASPTSTPQIPPKSTSIVTNPGIPSRSHPEHSNLIGGIAGGLGALVVIIGLGFAFYRYRKYRLALREAHMTGFHEVKNGVNFASLFSCCIRSGRKQMILPMNQNDQSSSLTNEPIEDRPSTNRFLGLPSERRKGARFAMEAARRQRQILELDLEERVSHRGLEDDNMGRRDTETEQRLRDGIRQMSRRIAELETELEMEVQAVDLPPPDYVSLMPVETETVSRRSMHKRY